MKFLKKSFNGMEPYFSKSIEDGVILNANESPFNPPKKVIDLYMKEIKKIHFNRYPDMQNLKLCEALAKHYNVKEENVCCGVGSDELLEVTFKAVLEPKDVVISFSPSFSMYKVFADLALADFKEIFLDEDLSFPVEEMIDSIKKNNPKLVLICNPNNPTGSFLNEKDIRRIIESTDALVLLDFAYIDFAECDYTYLASQYDNVIVFRTFSKAMSLPSIRVGYAIANKDNIDMINAVKAPYSLSVPSQIMARIAIENYDLYKDNIKYLILERERVYNILKDKFIIYPSKANFLFLKLEEHIFKELEENKIYIRKMKNNMYRISIGTKEENDKLLKVVMKYA